MHGTVEDAWYGFLETTSVEFHTTFQQHAIVVIIVVYKLSYDLQWQTHLCWVVRRMLLRRAYAAYNQTWELECCSINPAGWGYEPHFLISCKLYQNSSELSYLILFNPELNVTYTDKNNILILQYGYLIAEPNVTSTDKNNTFILQSRILCYLYALYVWQSIAVYYVCNWAILSSTVNKIIELLNY